MLGVYNGTAFTVAGITPSVAAGATIEIRRESDNAIASIWSDEAGTAPITNPSAFADSAGRYQFFAYGVDRGYSIKVTKSGFNYTLHNQMVGNAGQRDWPSVQFERNQRRARHFAALNLV